MAILKFTAKTNSSGQKLKKGESFTMTLPQPHSRPSSDEMSAAIEAQTGEKTNGYISHVDFDIEVIKR